MSDDRQVEVLLELLDAFNGHDLDAIMSHFAEDCVLEAPRGPDRCGRRFVGKAEVRGGLAARFEGIPNVHYSDDNHFASGLAVSPSGRSPARPSTASSSTSAAVTSGSSTPTGSSRARTASGRSATRSPGRRPEYTFRAILCYNLGDDRASGQHSTQCHARSRARGEADRLAEQAYTLERKPSLVRSSRVRSTTPISTAGAWSTS